MPTCAVSVLGESSHRLQKEGENGAYTLDGAYIVVVYPILPLGTLIPTSLLKDLVDREPGGPNKTVNPLNPKSGPEDQRSPCQVS